MSVRCVCGSMTTTRLREDEWSRWMCTRTVMVVYSDQRLVARIFRGKAQSQSDKKIIESVQRQEFATSSHRKQPPQLWPRPDNCIATIPQAPYHNLLPDSRESLNRRATDRRRPLTSMTDTPDRRALNLVIGQTRKTATSYEGTTAKCRLELAITSKLRHSRQREPYYSQRSPERSALLCRRSDRLPDRQRTPRFRTAVPGRISRDDRTLEAQAILYSSLCPCSYSANRRRMTYHTSEAGGRVRSICNMRQGETDHRQHAQLGREYMRSELRPSLKLPFQVKSGTDRPKNLVSADS